MTIDKIKHHVNPSVIEVINECVQLGEIDALRNWLEDCKAEINRRETQKENTYPLYFEKAYLEMVLS